MRKAKVLGAMAAVAALGMVAFVLLSSERPNPNRMPANNGYPELLRAAHSVSFNFQGVSDQGVTELKAAMSTNFAALELARAAMQRECHVIVDATFPTNSLVDYGAFKKLAHAFRAEATIAQAEGGDNHISRAASSLLDLVRLGHECARGGPMMSAMVGVAIEKMGCDRLEQLVSLCDADTAARCARTLSEIEKRRQPAAKVLENEAFYAKQIYGWKSSYLRLLTHSMLRKAEQSFTSKHQAQKVATEKLTLKFTERAQGAGNEKSNSVVR